MEKRIGRALIISGIILQRYAGIPFWLTLCFVLSGFVWMEEYGEEA